MDSVYIQIGVINSHPFRVESRQRLRIRQQSVRFPLVQPFLQMAEEIFFDDLLVGVVKNFFRRQGGEFFHTGIKLGFGPFMCGMLYLADRWETQGIDGLQSAFADYHGFAQRALSIRI